MIGLKWNAFVVPGNCDGNVVTLTMPDMVVTLKVPEMQEGGCGDGVTQNRSQIAGDVRTIGWADRFGSLIVSCISVVTQPERIDAAAGRSTRSWCPIWR
jgi:hypothetical protein